MRAVVGLDIKVIDGTAVRDYKSVILPSAAQHVIEKEIACAAWISGVTVVCTHELADVRIHCKCLECRKIGFPKITR